MGVDVTVDTPPTVSRTGAGGGARLVPVTSAIAAMAMLGLAGVTASSARSPMLIVFPVLLLASAVVGVATGGGRARADLTADRTRYLRYLDELSARLADDAAAQRDWMLGRHPDPDALWAAARWTRDSGDPDIGLVRVGIGEAPAATRVISAEPDRSGDPDPVTVAALDRLLHAHRMVPGVPVTVDLFGGAVTVSGTGARALVRALICQLASTHHPNIVALAAHTDEIARDHWDWLKWLPHQDVSPSRVGRRVIVVDGGAEPVPDPGVTVVRVIEDGPSAGLRVRHPGGEVRAACFDQMTVVAASTLARRLAAHRDRQPVGGPGWAARVGLQDPRCVDPDALWQKASDAKLCVPIGVGADGRDIDLDIREAAAGGMGPHGLCLGATGSGKSELLRTIALGMIARHSPEALNLILVDFKGGATFLDFARARHITAVITNLEDEAHLVDRMRDALGGEIDRRQRMLRAAGNLTGIAEYQRARCADSSLAPLPALFIIVDEFSELLHRHPEFVEVFVAIGRLGRSLGMHLLLASQRLDEGRLRGLDSHLSYRICLKTLSDSESRVAIGVPDAYQLPGRPGAGYLKVGAADPVRFQASYVSGPLPAPRVAAPVPTLFIGNAEAAAETAADSHLSLLQAVIDGLADHGPPPHQVWLPPLTESPTLDALPSGDGLQVAIGVLDRAFEHRRESLLVDLSGAAGNVAIIGAPRSGKSTALRTLVTALATGNDARRLAVYGLDFGGGDLADLAVLPQVSAVAAGSQVGALATRILAEVAAVLRRREAGTPDPADPTGDVLLVVDGWAAARRDHADLEATVTAIAGSGLGQRVHVALTASRWADLRPALRDQIGTRIELRLGDPADSEIDRARAARVPRDRPGHGLDSQGYPMVIALPGNASDRVRNCPDGWRVAPIRLLPQRIDHPELLAVAPGDGCLLGVGENGLGPVALDFTEPHLVVFGEPGCGKTAVLRLLCREIARAMPQAEVFAVDPRGTLSEFGGDGLRRVPLLLERLRERATATPIFVVIDDYDLAAAVLAPLAEVVAARDIGVHVLIARRSGGAARALYDPVLSGLRESGAMGLQMSGCPEDGPLVGSVRPTALPPGRGILVTRTGGTRTLQVAWTEPR